MKLAIALGFAVVSLASGSAFAGDAAAGKAKAAACAGCHGATGISAVPTYPNLAGQKEAYLVKAINDYKSGARSDATMKAMVGALSDADVANLAAYYAGLK
ncbi:MAG: c-type cytochrome [Chromatiales bacterium]|nr:c-type cytochrome [Chromatiales bacterium]